MNLPKSLARLPGMKPTAPDVRFGHDVKNHVQDAHGVDILQLREQLKLSVEERFRRLQQHAEFVERLRGAARR